MNLFSKKLLFILASSTVFLAGCSKKPKRPSPDQTVIGPGTGSTGGGGLAGTEIPTDPSLAPGTELDARTANLGPDGQIRGQLQAVFFAFDQSAVRASERSKLADAQKYLAGNPTHRILLEGHCDWRGTPEYNLGLGDRRANSARQYLESLGVPAAKIEVVSKGDLEAIENAAEDVMSRDRRVEVVILTK